MILNSDHHQIHGHLNIQARVDQSSLHSNIENLILVVGLDRLTIVAQVLRHDSVAIFQYQGVSNSKPESLELPTVGVKKPDLRRSSIGKRIHGV